MDEILEKYKSSRFEDCLCLLKKILQTDDSLLENCIKQNCLEICQCLVFISRNDSGKIVDTLRNLFKRYQSILAIGLPGVLIPVQLEMTSLFNFIWWNLFYLNEGSDEIIYREGYLPILQRGLRRVLGISCKINRSDNITEEILFDIKNAGKIIEMKDYSTVCLLAEVILLTLLYILKVNCSKTILELCLETVTTFIKDVEIVIQGLEAVKDFEESCPFYEKLFKFGFRKINSSVSEITICAIDCLYIIKLLCFLLLREYESVFFVLKKNLNNTMKPLRCYIGGISSLMMEDYNKCLGFVLMSEGSGLDRELKSRFSILHGQLLSRKEDYKGALKCFMEAKSVSPSTDAIYYYMGEEYGKIGLSDEMVDCFKNAIKVKQEYRTRNVSPFTTTFESIILSLIHPANEISESEIIYAAAVASGLTEKYQESAEMFEKYMEVRSLERQDLTGDRIIKTPQFVTILHEAATMNILTGNSTWAEHILSQAANHYNKLDDFIEKPKMDVHVTKDVNWLRNLLHEELGLNGPADEEKVDSIELFSEEMVYFFEEDVIAMMLSAEMACQVDVDLYRTTLAKLISIFSKYLAQMQKKESIPEREKLRWTLVKALSGRTCLNIANYQLKKEKHGVEIERTFKRALSCNQGDKDILYGYCKFLLGTGKTNDAHKLWKTFHEKEPAVIVDQCQSLALRYLLRAQVTREEWEKIEMNMRSTVADIDFHL